MYKCYFVLKKKFENILRGKIKKHSVGGLSLFKKWEMFYHIRYYYYNILALLKFSDSKNVRANGYLPLLLTSAILLLFFHPLPSSFELKLHADVFGG